MMTVWQTRLSAPVTSYSNPGGMGNRTGSVEPGLIIVTSDWSFTGTIDNLIDGDYTANTTHGINPTAAASGKVIRFDFSRGIKQYINEAKLYWANTGTLSLKWRVSNDGVTYLDAGSAFTIDAMTKTVALAPPDFAGYRYYQLQSQGGTLPAGFFTEVEFKIAAGAT